jgi:hypothetical protein
MERISVNLKATGPNLAVRPGSHQRFGLAKQWPGCGLPQRAGHWAGPRGAAPVCGESMLAARPARSRPPWWRGRRRGSSGWPANRSSPRDSMRWRAPAGQGRMGGGASDRPGDERGGASSTVQSVPATAAGEEVGDCSGVTLHDQWDIRITPRQREEDETVPAWGSRRQRPCGSVAPEEGLRWRGSREVYRATAELGSLRARRIWR